MKIHLPFLYVLVAGLWLTANAEASTALEDFVGTNSVIDAVVQQLRLRNLDGDPAKVEEIIISTLVQSADPQARILSDAEVTEFTRAMNGYSRTAGILIESGESHPLVGNILNPADISIPVGSRILSIDGTPAEGKDIFTVYRELCGGTDDTVKLVTSNDSECATTSSVPLVSCQMPALMGSEMLPRNISYIKLRGLYGDAASVLAAVGSALSHTNTLGTIIDLRDAGGANLANTVSLTELFQGGSETLFTIESLSDKTLRKYTRRQNDIEKSPVLILVDGETRGASEVFAAVCKDCKTSIVILGEETAGDLVLRDFVTLPSGIHLYLLAYSMVTAAGTEYNGLSGVVPDIQVAASARTAWSPGESYDPFYDRKTAKGEEENQRLIRRLADDTVLRRGVDILIGLDALNLN